MHFDIPLDYDRGKLYEGVYDDFYDVYNKNNKKAGTYKEDVGKGRYILFPPQLAGTWKRDKIDNTLTFTANTIKASNQSFTWNLTNMLIEAGGSNDEYYISPSGTDITDWVVDPDKRRKMTIQISGNSLTITGSGDGSGDNNLNGTWKRQ